MSTRFCFRPFLAGLALCLSLVPAAAQIKDAIVGAQRQRRLALASPVSVRRVALVIGNGAYSNAPLKNPLNDAQDMAQMLSALRFDVILRTNLNKAAMDSTLREFSTKIRTGGGAVGLFYYAGHGLQVNRENYLVPIDAQVESEDDVAAQCLAVESVLEQMQRAGSNMSIIILDACRNNPFRGFRSTSRGLAGMSAPSGTVIACATQPNSVASDGRGRNSPYTQELLKFLPVANLRLQEVFSQVRESVFNETQGRQDPWWQATSMMGEFYFAGAAPTRPTSAETVDVGSNNHSDVNPRQLLAIIKSQQRDRVRESVGEAANECFSIPNLEEFKRNRVPQLVKDSLRHDGYFIDVVLAIRQMRPEARESLLKEGAHTYKPTWAELGRISPEGQTRAGQEAERLIAEAIVDLVKEIAKLSRAELDDLRQ